VTAVNSSDTGSAAEGFTKILSQCRNQSWCWLPAAIYKGGLAPCPICATGGPLFALTEEQFNAASVNTTPPPAQFTGDAMVERSVPRAAAGRSTRARVPTRVPRDRTRR